MSVKIMSRVWDDSKHKGSARLTLLAIADNANDIGHCWPGIDTELKRKTLLTTRGIGKIIDRVVTSGNELLVYPRPGHSHNYVVSVGMSYYEVKAAIKEVAKWRKLSIPELSKLRTEFISQATHRVHTTYERRTIAGTNPVPLEPSLPVKNHHSASHGEFWEAALYYLFGIVWEEKSEATEDQKGMANKYGKWFREKTSLDPNEIRRFRQWWHADKPGMTIPQKYDSILMQIAQWQASPAPSVSAGPEVTMIGGK